MFGSARTSGVELVGEGGHGTVYKSWDEALSRWAAVKVLHARHSESDRLIWESQAARFSGLSHPQIAALYDFGEKAGQPFLVIEYLSGGSLYDRIRALPPG